MALSSGRNCSICASQAADNSEAGAKTRLDPPSGIERIAGNVLPTPGASAISEDRLQ